MKNEKKYRLKIDIKIGDLELYKCSVMSEERLKSVFPWYQHSLNWFEEIEQEQWLTPKTDKDRVFDFVECEVWDDDFEARESGKLIAFVKDSDYPFKVVSVSFIYDAYKNCRIKMFSHDNPPPVDTLVFTGGGEYHFSHFDDNKDIHVFVKRRTSKTVRSTSICDNNYKFHDFEKSAYKLWEG